ncbi:MAG: PEP/pyruvate-binding domain-containing protein [Planctomycetota bacterium]
MKQLLTFDDPLARRVELTGGKGSSLAFFTQSGFSVPAGFIVTSRSYLDFIAPAHELLLGVRGFSFDDPARLRSESEQLRASLADFHLSDSLKDDIRSTLESQDESSFAVRSSSTMEDLASAAFAGQHDSYLNCRGADEVIDKVKSCFLSLWNDRAIAYRQKQGFDHLLAEMAVVVQRMVQCDVAGVGFSMNPINGELDEMVVDANFGLGESVVSGEGEVDHFVIDKKSGTEKQSHIAQKTLKVVASDEGTEEVAIDPAEGESRSLDSEQISHLAELLKTVEETARFPQDIEWGFAGADLHLLQSRPVTTIPARWTRDESAERFPNVITALTWDFVEAGFHRSLNYSFSLMNFPPFDGKWFGMHDHYIYGNQNAVEIYGRRTQVAPKTIEELEAAIPLLRESFRWVQELPVIWSRDLDDYLIRIGRFQTQALEDEDLAGAWKFVHQVNQLGAEYFLPNIAISIAHGGLYRTLHQILSLAVPEDANNIFDSLMAFCETKTGAINKELFELATLVRSQPDLEAALAEKDAKKVIDEGVLDGWPDFAQRFDKFLSDHGHREIDFDAYQPTWVEVPWVVLDNVRLILQTPMEPTPYEKERELKVRMQQTEVELYSRLPEGLHFFFAEILRLARLYTSLDDLEHYQTTRLTIPMRKGLLVCGERLCEKGVLDDPTDIFFARLEDLDQAVEEDSPSCWRAVSAAVEKEKNPTCKPGSGTLIGSWARSRQKKAMERCSPGCREARVLPRERSAWSSGSRTWGGSPAVRSWSRGPRTRPGHLFSTAPWR